MRLRFNRLVVSALLLAPLLSPLHAQLLDQANPVPGRPFQSLQHWMGTSFRPGSTTSVGGNIGVYGNGTFSGFLTVELYGSLPDGIIGPLAVANSAAFAMTDGQQAMIGALWSPVTVTPGATYFLFFHSSDPFDHLYGMYREDPFNTYTAGDLYYQPTNSFNFLSGASGGMDLIFEEYSASPDPVVITPETTVPEPASVVLVACGLAGVCGVARLRRKPLA